MKHPNGDDAQGGFAAGLAEGVSSSTHEYREFDVALDGVVAGDQIELWHRSADGSGGQVTGDGQTLYAKNFEVYSSSPTVEENSSLAGNTVFAGTALPDGNNTRNLGSTSLRWAVLYTANSVNVSDKTLKENIMDCNLGLTFVNTLQPKSYKMKDIPADHDDYNRTHFGLLAQDLIDTELSGSVFGERDGEYSLAYNDVIAPMIKAIQELSAQVTDLKKEIEELKS